MADKTLKQARQYLQGKVAGLTSAPVYEYLRQIKSKQTLMDLATVHDEAGDDHLEMWTITREGSGAEPDTDVDEVIDYTFVRPYVLVIDGYHAVEDAKATEVAFQDEIETVLDGLDADPTLGSNCDEALPATVRTVDHRWFGDILCHHCEIILTVRMRRDRQ